MRPLLAIAVCAALLAAPLASSAQDTMPTPETQPTTPQARVEAALAGFLSACRAGDFATAGAHVVYRGDDDARRWNDTCSVAAPDELAAVQQVCNRAVAYDPEAAGYAVQGFEMETEGEGTWHALSVTYTGSGEEVTYAFLEINGVFAIGDID